MAYMAQTSTPQVTQNNGAFSKTFKDRDSYRSELDVLRGLKGTEVAPELLGHDDRTMTLHLANAGADLNYLLNSAEQSFSVSQIRRVMGGLLKGLSDLHSQGYCHYDVTPRNVCIDGDLQGDFRVKLIDYGLSFSLDKIPETHKKQRIGTPSCLSPEHLACTPQFGEAADVFCAGVTILQVVQGGLDVFSPSYGKIEPQIAEAHQQVPTKTFWGEAIPGQLTLLLKSMLTVDPTYRRSRLCLDLLGAFD